MDHTEIIRRIAMDQIKIITELGIPKITCPHCNLEYGLIYQHEAKTIGITESDYCPRCGNPSRLSISPGGTLKINVSEQIGIEDRIVGG